MFVNRRVAEQHPQDSRRTVVWVVRFLLVFAVVLRISLSLFAEPAEDVVLSHQRNLRRVLLLKGEPSSDTMMMMNGRTLRSYAEWESPITSDFITKGSVSLSSLHVDGNDVFWSEGRPSDRGRHTVVRCSPEGAIEDVTHSSSYNVRSAVHEYGGGEFSVHDGKLFFVNWDDQRLYCKRLGSHTRPEPLTPVVGGRPLLRLARYADMCNDPAVMRVFAVRELHSPDSAELGGKVVNSIVQIGTRIRHSVQTDDLESTRRDHSDPSDADATLRAPIGNPSEFRAKVVASGHDFYSSPRVAPRGLWLSYVAWDHPNMPWDNVRLYARECHGDGTFGEEVHIAGFDCEESIVQPTWSPDGKLYFLSDRSNWWNLYRWDPDTLETMHILERQVDFGFAAWRFGRHVFDFVDDTHIVGALTDNKTLGLLDVTSGCIQELPSAFATISDVRVAKRGLVYFFGGSSASPMCVVQYDLIARTERVLRCAMSLELPRAYLSTPQSVTFSTSDNMVAHGYFYRPTSALFAAPEGELPPLLVMSHGGPTGAARTTLRLDIQYWTSRGFAVLDVNYRGSVGFGRVYRQSLEGKWGVYDVDDCCAGAEYLVEQGLVDGGRLAITGKSAGGYTTLAALTFRSTFHAGTSHFGVGDLEALVRDTHKFESHYLDKLIGPYPEARDLYLQRSPIHHVDELHTPIALFQGLEDKIVPPNQAQSMFEAVVAKGLPVAYVEFEGEQHGFRQGKNIQMALDGEFFFYSRVFGFAMYMERGDFRPPKIHNDPNVTHASKRESAASAPPVRRRMRNWVLLAAAVALLGAMVWRWRAASRTAPALIRHGADYTMRSDVKKTQ